MEQNVKITLEIHLSIFPISKIVTLKVRERERERERKKEKKKNEFFLQSTPIEL